MARRKDLMLTEFVVTVQGSGIDWGGLDVFLWRLMHSKPKEGFLPHVLAARSRRGCRSVPSK